MGPGGCPTPRNALAYKLRAPDLAVLDFYAALSKRHKSGIDPRCFPQAACALSPFSYTTASSVEKFVYCHTVLHEVQGVLDNKATLPQVMHILIRHAY